MSEVYIPPVTGGSVSSTAPVIGGLLVNAKFLRLQFSNISIGDTDLYTVPANRAAVILSYSWYNPSAGTIAAFAEFKVSGTYYKYNSTASIATLSNSFSPQVLFLNAGEIYAINTATTNGLNGVVEVVEFDPSSNLKLGRKLGLSTGDNTIYTCPGGKTAIPLGAATAGGLGLGGTASTYFQADGTTRHIFWNAVPSGGSPGSGNQISASQTVTGGLASLQGIMVSYGSGDFLSINVDVGNSAQHAGQIVWEM
jgi:hypothetical protein